jgi:hypothetical protein
MNNLMSPLTDRIIKSYVTVTLETVATTTFLLCKVEGNIILTYPTRNRLSLVG